MVLGLPSFSNFTKIRRESISWSGSLDLRRQVASFNAFSHLLPVCQTAAHRQIAFCAWSLGFGLTDKPSCSYIRMNPCSISEILDLVFGTLHTPLVDALTSKITPKAWHEVSNGMHFRPSLAKSHPNRSNKPLPVSSALWDSWGALKTMYCAGLPPHHKPTRNDFHEAKRVCQTVNVHNSSQTMAASSSFPLLNPPPNPLKGILNAAPHFGNHFVPPKMGVKNSFHLLFTREPQRLTCWDLFSESQNETRC